MHLKKDAGYILWILASYLFHISVYFRRNLDYHEVLQNLAEKGISIRVASPKLVMEEVCLSHLLSAMQSLHFI